jgi:Transcriptional regulators
MATTKQLRDPRSLPDQLAEVLRARIATGEWAPGEQLPSENALAEETGVSRPTVRAALRNLTTSGLIRVRQGAGTFVAPRGPGVVTGLQDLRSMSTLIAEQRGDCDVEYRLREMRMATDEEAAHFDASGPLRIIAIERCFVSQGAVVAYEWAYMNAEVLPANFDHNSFTASIFDQLKLVGLLPEQAIATVHAVYDDTIAWSEKKPEVPLYLRLAQHQFLQDGRVLSWSQTYFTEGNFEFLVVRTR